MVVDFGRGSGFVAVDIGLFYGGLWVNGRVAGFCTYSTTCRRPSLSLQFLTLANPSRGFAVFNVGFEFNDLWV